MKKQNQKNKIFTIRKRNCKRFTAILLGILMIMVMGNYLLSNKPKMATNDMKNDFSTRANNEMVDKWKKYDNNLKISAEATNVCISEIVPDGAVGEWIELYNPKSNSISLTGWIINDTAGNEIDLSSITIPANGVITFGDDDAPTDYNITLGILNNDGDSVFLENSTGHIQDAIVYGSSIDVDKWYWNSTETAPDPDTASTGESLQRINRTVGGKLEDNNLPSDWKLSSTTPGTLPQYSPPYGKSLIISEIKPEGDEWVEIYNPYSESGNLTGWILEDEVGNSVDLSAIAISSYGVVTFGDGNAPTNYNITLGFLNNAGDSLILKNSTGHIQDVVIYGNMDSGYNNTVHWNSVENAPDPDGAESIQRINETISWGLQDTNQPSDWEVNLSPSPGSLPQYVPPPPKINQSLIITEIKPEGDEWVEIYNPHGTSGSLDGWELYDETGTGQADLSEISIPAYGIVTFGDNNAPTDYNISLPALNNDGDAVILRNATGDIQDVVIYGNMDSNYNNTVHWNSVENAPDPDGAESIQRINETISWGLQDTNQPSDWEVNLSPSPGSLPQYIPPGESQNASSVLITEVMIGPRSDEFEYIEIYNTLDEGIVLTGWQIWASDDWESGSPDLEVSGSFNLPARSYGVFIDDESAWNGEYGYSGLNYSESLSLRNSSPDDIILTDPNKNIIDRVAWRTSDPFEETIDNSSWVDDGIYIGSSSDTDMALTRLYNPNQNDDYVDTNSSHDWRYDTVPSLGKHSNNSLFLSGTIEGNATVTAFSSPDNSFTAFSQLFASAQYNLDICVYQFTSYWILQDVFSALDRGVHVRLLVEGESVGGTVDKQGDLASEIVYIAEEIESKENGSVKWVSQDYMNYYHSKYFIIDNNTVIISTENFKYTGIPKDPSAGNRGWGIAVNNTEIAKKYLNVYNFDWGLANNFSYYDLVSPKKNDKVLEGNYKPIFDEPQTYEVSNTYFQTVVGPDETIDVVVDLINKAQDKIYAELFYLYPTWDTYYGGKNNNPLMNGLIDAAKRDVMVQVILDSTYYNIYGNNNNDEAAAILKSHGVQIKYSNNSGGIEKFHVKALIVDEEAVMISSLNWNENSATNNREIGIIVNSSQVASYYVQLFKYDWEGYSSLNLGGQDQQEGFLQTTTWLTWLPIVSVLYVGILAFGFGIRRKKEKIQKKKEFAQDRIREQRATELEGPKKEKEIDIKEVRKSVRETYGDKVNVPHLDNVGRPLDNIEPTEFVRNFIKHNHGLLEIGKYVTPIDRVAILKYREDRYIAFDAETDLEALLSTEYLKKRVKELEQRLQQKDNKMDTYMSKIGDIEKKTENIKAQEDNENLAESLAEQERKIQDLKEKMFQIQKEKKQLKEEMAHISEEQKSPLNELVADLQTKITKQKLLIKKLKEKEEKDDPFTFEPSSGER